MGRAPLPRPTSETDGHTMTFIHGYLLGGLLLAGVPVLLHLILRQKPKRLPFPAFRFLKARQRINSRRMQLQHFLLLALRVLVLAALCLALARPRIFANRLGMGGGRPVLAAFVVDTSPSMEYTVGGASRLDDARRRMRELLDEMASGSQVALIESGEESQALLLPPGEVRSRLEAVRIRHGAASLNQALDRALRLLEQQGGEEGQPRLVYVFSDRTRGCWDPNGVKPPVPEGVNVLFIDVGVESPRDLGISGIEIVPAVVAPGARYEVRVSVRGTPTGHENELSCSVDGDAEAGRPADRRPVQLAEGVNSEQVVFERTAPVPPADGVSDLPVQVSVRLAARDALQVNNSRHATFVVRGSRRLLTLVDRADARKTQAWQAVLNSRGFFVSEVRTFEEAGKLTAQELARYPAVALFEPANVPADWWPKLRAHVTAGGGLAIVPPGDEMGAAELKAFNAGAAAAGLLPAPLLRLAAAPARKPVYWERFTRGHPLMADFVRWTLTYDPDFGRDDLRPFVRRYWQVGELAKGGIAVIRYADADRHPALAELPLGRGRVLLFTLPLDFGVRWTGEDNLPWHNYFESSFGLVLIDLATRYLGGEVAAPVVNFPAGVAPQLTLSSAPPPPLTVAGPMLSGGERNLRPPTPEGTVTVPQAAGPGNYQILDGKERTVAGFSLEIPAKETDLERVGDEELEAVFGTGNVVRVNQSVTLADAIRNLRPPPVELLPYLMLLLLAVLTFESLLSNRFYRRPAEQEEPAPPPLSPEGGKP